MSIHEQLDLVFEKDVESDGSIYFACRYYKQESIPILQRAIMTMLLWDCNSRDTDLSESLIEDINNILNNTFIGIDGEDNEVEDYIGNRILRLDLEDGFAYFAEGFVLNPPTISLTDLRTFLHEWIEFVNENS